MSRQIDHVAELDASSVAAKSSGALEELKEFYFVNGERLKNAAETVTRILRGVLDETREELTIHDISGRVKSFDSCVQKYNRKYRSKHETAGGVEKIADLITDLIGIRIVCLYEDDINRVADIVRSTFDVPNQTEKAVELKKDPNRFGYQALHCDLHLGAPRIDLGEYRSFSGINVELQIRTIFQDAWSVLDHQLKYKKTIHPSLSRRINVFAALCELADQEFMRIRDDIRAAPVDASESSAILSSEDGVMNLRAFLDVLHNNFPSDAILPDQADILLSVIMRLNPAINVKELARMFGEHMLRLQESYDAFRIRTRKTLSPLTRTRILLNVADQKKYGELITSSDLRDLCSEILNGLEDKA